MITHTLKILAVSLGLCAAADNLAAQVTVTIIHSFTHQIYSGGGDGGLVQGKDGYFYGTTFAEGTNRLGSVFRISPNGDFTNLYSFGSYATDGIRPAGGVIQASDGNFYGATVFGGTTANASDGLLGQGTIFEISPSGSYTNLHSFDGSDGAEPYGGLVQGSDGSFYGATQGGGPIPGAADGGFYSFNNINGVLKDLYWSDGYTTDGVYPWTLVQDSDGNLYGTTRSDASNNGTVCRINPTANYTNCYANLYVFGSIAGDGSGPEAGLLLASDGTFYGTTAYGGTNGSNGTIFHISTNGIYTSLYSFSGYPDGGWPYATLVVGRDGNLYGTTSRGGTHAFGTVFRITLGGNYTNVYSFGINSSDGEFPSAPLVLGKDGNFYGTTGGGGTNGYGTVFKLVIPTVLSYQNTGGTIVLSWNDPLSVLQTATAVTDTYTNIPGATSPYTNTITGPQQFFRLLVSQ